MRVITETFKVYKFDELSEASKEKAIDKHIHINVNFDWWEVTYEDVKNHLGLQLQGFDIGRGSNVDYNKSELMASIRSSNDFLEALKEYYPTKEYLQTMVSDYSKRSAEYEKSEYSERIEAELDQIEYEITSNLDYMLLTMLREEYDYLTSKEAIIETFEANEYEFKENGEIY